jgi:hypothetical protein
MEKICPRCDSKHKKKGKYCCRQCANSRSWSIEDRRNKSIKLKEYFQKNGHHSKGKPGWRHSDEMKELKRLKSIQQWDDQGRLTKRQKALVDALRAHNYRARKLNAIPPDADLKLIRRIIEACPKGYDVDHIVSLSKGGLHHQDNLQYLPASENRRKGNRDIYDESLAIRWQDVLNNGETNERSCNKILSE